jgi:hypothetical protein
VPDRVEEKVMTVLRIEHGVPDYDGWRRAFDNDPLDRKGSGVVRYQVFRSVDDPNFVMIDLELGSTAEAEAMLARLHQLWAGPGKAVTQDPHARIVEPVDSVEL